MSQQPTPRKRTRSQTVGKDLIGDEEPALSKRQILEDENAHQTQQSIEKKPNDSSSGIKTKELKRKLKKIEDSKTKDDNPLKAQNQSNIAQSGQQMQKKKMKKHKETEKEEKGSDSKDKKQKKKKKQKQKTKEDDQDVKEEQQKQGKKKAKKRNNEDEDEEQKIKAKKKKKDKSKEKQEKTQSKKPADSQDKAKEEQQQKQQAQKTQKKKDSQKKSKKSKKDKKDKKQKKKKKKKEQSDQSSNDQNQSGSQENDNESQEGGSSKKKKIKKETKRGRGRKPIGPVKRKKASIYQQQQIINKKYRVKKKSTYINKMSDRAWGQLRAGPYRAVKKYTKAEQRLIIDSLLGDGPKKEVSNADSKSQKQASNVKIQGENQQIPENQEKIEEEQSKARSQAESSDEQTKKQKSKSKKKSKKKSKENDSDKAATSTTASKKSKSVTSEQKVKIQSKSKSQKKKKAETDSEQSNDQKQAKIQDGQQRKNTKSKSKKKKKKGSESQSSSDDQKQTKGKKKSVKKDVKQQGSSKKTKVKAQKQEDHEFPKEQSQKIIDLFSSDGGNYPEMMKQLPGIRLKKVRMHLRMLFHRALDIITYQVQHRCGRKIKEWEQDQRIQIVRELHRIRSSNRLLSQANAHFREKMTALMRSYNDQSWLDKVSEQDIETLYRKLEAFVRGYNTINRSKRTSAASITESKNKQKEQRYKFSKQVTRKPIICGGHLLSKSVKSQEKEEHNPSQIEDQRTRSLIPPQKLIEEWNREQEKTLCQLYVSNQEADQTICDKLKEKYGPNIKWRDFELLGRKIDQLIKYALIKLQNLTARPYSKLQRQKQLLRKRAKLQLKLKKQQESQRIQYYKSKLKTTSMFLYDNQIFQKEERLQFKHRIFKNLSLLQRQIFGHIQSYKIKTALVKILIQEFPTEEDVEQAVKEAKKFSKWARQQERKSNITSIKNVFIGQREDRDFRDDNQNQDSIMADIEKIEICRKEGFAPQAHQLSDQPDQKSVLFVESLAGKAQQPIQLQNDNEQVEVSDFEEPESVRSNSNRDQQPASGESFKMLHKLYDSLNKPK